MTIRNEKIQEFIVHFPLLPEIAQKLNANSIDWFIAGSGCLFLFGNERIPDDVDIFIMDNDHDKADTLFNIKSFIYTSDVEKVRNSNPFGEHSLQLTSHLEFNLDKHYTFTLTEKIKQGKILFEYHSITYPLLPPEDVLLIKALLQRGPEIGKKDLEDIRNFMKIYKVNRDYLLERISELGAEDRVRGIF